MTQLHIKDASKHSDTGRITVEARIMDSVNGVEIEGAVEIWHIEALEIESKYHGRVEGWLEHIGREMLGRHRSRTAVHTDINKWKGKRMDIK